MDRKVSNIMMQSSNTTRWGCLDSATRIELVKDFRALYADKQAGRPIPGRLRLVKFFRDEYNLTVTKYAVGVWLENFHNGCLPDGTPLHVEAKAPRKRVVKNARRKN